MSKRALKSLILIGGLISTSVYADDIIISKPAGYTGVGPDQIIIQDKNVGATDEDPYGYHFQRGNNHGFLSSETPTVVKEGLTWNASYSHKGYESTNFINGNKNDADVWADKSHYDDVWGGENDKAGNHWGLDTILETQEYRQGPCDDGYHVPSAGEWSKIIEYRALANGQAVQESDFKSFSNATSREKFMQDLGLSFAGGRYYLTGSLRDQRFYGYYWSSSPYGSANPERARKLFLDSSYVSAGYRDYRSFGASVRCFKNFNLVSPNTYSLSLSASSGDLVASEEVSFSNGVVSYTQAVKDAIQSIRTALALSKKFFIEWYQTNTQGEKEVVDVTTINSTESVALSGTVKKKNMCKQPQYYHGPLN